MASEVCDALCRVLREGNDAQRCLAAQALGRIGDRDAVAALTVFLMDEDEDIRVDAAEALGLLRDIGAGAALLDSLVSDPCGDVKVKAVTALGRLGYREAAPFLRRLVRGRDDSVVWDDGEALGDGWDDWVDIQIEAVSALARMRASEAVPDIVAAIDDEMGQDLSEAGMTALSRLGEPGVAALAGYLKAKDERLRRRAAKALAEADFPAALGALVQALEDSSSDVRLAAARGLAKRDPGNGNLLALFGDADPEVRAEAVRLLGGYWPQRLEALLDDPSDKVQTAVLELLGADPGVALPRNAARRLRAKLDSPSVATAAAAAAALAVHAPDVALDDLAERLRDKAGPVRYASARALADIGTEDAVHVLVRAIGDDDRRLRLEAVVGLARIAAAGRSSRAREALLCALRGELVPPPAEPGGLERTPQTSSDAAQEKAAELPGRREGEASVEPDWPTSTLVAISGNLAVAAGEEKVALDQEDIAYLALARRLPRKRRVAPEPRVAACEDVPRCAARILGDVTGEDVAEALSEALSCKDIEVRRAAADSLARLAEAAGHLPRGAIAALEAACLDPDRDFRLAATRALGRAGETSAVPTLFRLLDDRDPFVRAEAVRSLAFCAAAGTEVERLMGDEEAGVRLAAAQAMAASGRAEAVARLVDFAVAFGGVHRRDAARLLRRLDPAAANARLLEALADPARKREWRSAIEALEELNRRDPAETARAPATASMDDRGGDQP